LPPHTIVDAADKGNAEHQVDARRVRRITPNAIHIALIAFALSGCSIAPPPADNAAALRDIASHDIGAEIVVAGPIVQVLPTSQGPSGVHERFIVAVSSGNETTQLFVADNVTIGALAPLRAGEQVTVKGELDFNEFGPVLHWTHRDPRMRHQPGFVEVAGHLYE
jgi:Protein of unknown function (DUF3465)